MKLASWKIGTKFVLAFLALVLAVAASSGVNWMQFQTADDSTDFAMSRARVLLGLEQAMASVVDQETGVRGYLLSGNPAFLEPMRNGKANLDNAVAALKAEWTANPDQLVRLAAFLGSFETWRRDVAEREIQLMGNAATQDQARQMEIGGAGKTHMDAMRSKVAEIAGIAKGRMAGALAAKDDAVSSARWALIIGGVAVAIMAIGSAVLLTVTIARPIRGMTEFMNRLAAGDTQAEVPARGRGDEIGSMASAVQVFKDNMIRTKALEAETENARASAEVQRKRTMLELADGFERAVGGIVDTVSSASTELNATAGAMTTSAADTASQATMVSSSAEEASVNVAAVASATEEMGASINEIGRQVHHSAQMCEGAVVEARESARLINELSLAANRIGDVVSIISDIAGQTNLLALNATIEAARAGEAGRGFAVVATEVKQLAAQTAKATAEISSQIEAIQNSTSRAVTAVSSIGETIAGLNATAGAISSAVSQQTAATQEIVHNVSQVSIGTGNVTSTITGVARAAGETGAAASQVLTASGELSEQSEKLRLEMGRFLDTIRAA